MNRLKAVSLVLSMTLLSLSAPRLLAQAQNTGTVAGNVVDQQGHVVSGAVITLTEVTEGKVTTAKSSNKGEYLFSDVAVGNYQMKVVAPTFGAVIINDIAVNADVNVREDAHMVPGSVDSTVTVEAEGTTLDTRSATIGTMLDKNLVENLPIDGENIVSLAALLPGVTNVNAPTTFTSDTGGPTYSVSGSRGNSNLFLFDGENWNNSFYNTGLNFPPRLALEEVSVLLNNYKAQYGRSSGSIFNALSRRGSNTIHGSIWEYYQNSYFDAADYITGLNPHMISNQFGATIGGPIKRDKAFFFLSYGDLRLVDGFAARATPPTLAELGYDAPGVPHICSAGSITPGLQCADISQDFGYNGWASVPGSAATLKLARNPYFINSTVATKSLQTSYNIANGFDPSQTALQSPCVTALTLYAKEYLPTTEYPTECFDPTAVAFVRKYLPLAKTVATQTTSVAAQPQNNQQGMARVDLALGRHSVDAHFYVTNVNDVTSNSVSAGVGVPGASRQLNVAGIYSGNIGDTYVITPNILNVARAAYKRYTYIILPTDRTTLPMLAGGIYSQPGPNFLPSFEATNRFTVGSTNSSDSRNVTANYELDDSLSWQRGSHNFQFGGQFLDLIYLRRQYTEPKFVSEQQYTGAASTDFLSGLLYSATVGNLTNLAAKQYALYTYAQDDWRLTPKLTLNLGVRWELPFSWKEIDQQGTTFNPGYQSHVFPMAPASVAYQGDPGYPNTAPPTKYNNVAPRVGFAYDVFGNGRLAIRGGYGIFYDSLNANLVGVGEPYHYSAFYASPQGGLSYPLMGDPAIPADYSKGSAPNFVLPYTINYADPNLKNPYTEAVNFGFQLHVNKGSTLEMNYVGKFGRHQIIPYDNNPAIVDCSGSYYQSNPIYCPGTSTIATATYSQRVLYPGFNYGGQGVVDNNSIGSSSYNGYQVIYSQKAVAGITTYASYSLSRSIDINSNGATNTAHVPRPNHMYLERAASDFNATHILNIGWTWKLPKVVSGARAVDALLSNWEYGGIFNARTGNPINIALSGDISGTDERIQRPALVPGQNPVLPSNRHRVDKVNEWFNVAAFAAPAFGTFSNLPRNYLVGPAYLNTNMDLVRRFVVPHFEHDSIEVRVDAFNVWNTPNLANPNVTLSSSTSNQNVNIFGQVAATVGTNNSIGSNGRRLQFGFIFRY